MSKTAKLSNSPRVPYPHDSSKDRRTVISNTNSGSGFKIGDRVYVGGIKLGTISFIGNTKFADGEWAGVNLDNPNGKNDGSVNGVRYFQCSEKHGLFSRMNNLFLEPKTDLDASMVSNPPNQTSKLDKLAPTPKHANNSASSSLEAVTPQSGQDYPELVINSRVIVGGTRVGTLRFVGPTEFAKGKGVFAGIELDEPNGKNDGSIDGHRYFSCKPRFGLFAPVRKVAPLNFVPDIGGSRKFSVPSVPPIRNARSGSQESVSSIGSGYSSTRNNRMRLGIMSLSATAGSITQPPPSHMTRTGSTSSPTETLKMVLKEKDDHIEQLLRERELEQSDVSRSLAKAEQAEIDRDVFQKQLDEALERIGSLENELAALGREKDDLSEKLEDLQFTMAEEMTDNSAIKIPEMLEIDVEALNAELSVLRNEKTDLENKFDSLNKEMSTLRFEKTELESRLESLSDEPTTLRSEKTELEDKMNSFSDEIATMRQTNGELQKQLNNLNTEILKLQNEKLELQNKNETLDKEMSSLRFENTELQCKVEDLKTNVQDTVNKVDEAKKSFDNVEFERNSIQSLLIQKEEDWSHYKRSTEERIQELIADISSLKSHEASLKSEMEALSSDKTSDEQMESLRNMYNDKCAVEDDLIRQVNTLQSVQKDLENNIASHISANEQSEKQLQEKRQECEKLNSSVADLKTEVDRVKSQLEVTQTSKEKILLELENSTRELLELQNKMDELNTEKHNLESDKNVLSDQNESLKSDVTNIKTNVAALKEQLASKLSEIEVVQQKCTTLNETVNHLKITIENQKTDLEFQANEFSTLEETLSANIADLQSKVNKLETEKIETETEKDLLFSEKENLETEKINLQSKISSLNENISTLSAQLQSVNNEYDDSKQRISELQQAIEKHKVDIKGKSDDLASEKKNVAKISKLLASKEEEFEVVSSDKQKLMVALTQSKEAMQKLMDKVDSVETSYAKKKVDYEKVCAKLTESEEALRYSEGIITELKQKSLLPKNPPKTPELQLIKEEKENAERQIDFLNTVIVDLKKKNDKLQSDLQLFMDSGTDDGVLKAGNNHVISGSTRLYCDICEEFDLHETEDCPIQGGSEPNTPPSRSHGVNKKSEPRPYCDSCEVFGHTTEECDEEETY